MVASLPPHPKTLHGSVKSPAFGIVCLFVVLAQCLNLLLWNKLE